MEKMIEVHYDLKFGYSQATRIGSIESNG